jgi:hypothetical protein
LPFASSPERNSRLSARSKATVYSLQASWAPMWHGSGERTKRIGSLKGLARRLSSGERLISGPASIFICDECEGTRFHSLLDQSCWLPASFCTRNAWRALERIGIKVGQFVGFCLCLHRPRSSMICCSLWVSFSRSPHSGHATNSSTIRRPWNPVRHRSSGKEPVDDPDNNDGAQN